MALLNGGVKQAPGGARPNNGRKSKFAILYREGLPVTKVAEAEASFAFLVSVRNNESAPLNVRVDCAKEILNRVIGKAVEMQPQSKDDELYKAYSVRVRSVIFDEDQPTETSGTQTNQSGRGAVHIVGNSKADH
jgi:hypothetical protein